MPGKAAVSAIGLAALLAAFLGAPPLPVAQATNSGDGPYCAATAKPRAGEASWGRAKFITAGEINPWQIRVSRLHGAPVFTSHAKKVGRVKDVVLDPDGRVAAVVLRVDGKNIALAMRNLHVVMKQPDSQVERVVVNATRRQLKSASAYFLKRQKSGSGSVGGIGSKGLGG